MIHDWKNPGRVTAFEADTEQAAAESEQDRRDHRRLAGDVAELLAHEDAMRLPIAVRRLVDAGVEPIVVAKTLAIGDRDGGLLYRLSTRAGVFALVEHEAIAVDWISLAIRDADPDLAADVMVSGATWLATQYGVDRELLVNLVTGTPRRPPRADRRGYGVVDLVDHHGVGDRASIATAIRLAQLPLFAPLEGAPFRGPV
jgi:hypothetical protein